MSTQDPPHMTRKHYEFLEDFATKAHAAIRQVIKDPVLQAALVANVMIALAHHLKGTNPTFNYDKFMEHVQQKLNEH